MRRLKLKWKTIWTRSTYRYPHTDRSKLNGHTACRSAGNTVSTPFLNLNTAYPSSARRRNLSLLTCCVLPHSPLSPLPIRIACHLPAWWGSAQECVKKYWMLVTDVCTELEILVKKIKSNIGACFSVVWNLIARGAPNYLVILLLLLLYFLLIFKCVS